MAQQLKGWRHSDGDQAYFITDVYTRRWQNCVQLQIRVRDDGLCLWQVQTLNVNRAEIALDLEHALDAVCTAAVQLLRDVANEIEQET